MFIYAKILTVFFTRIVKKKYLYINIETKSSIHKSSITKKSLNLHRYSFPIKLRIKINYSL